MQRVSKNVISKGKRILAKKCLCIYMYMILGIIQHPQDRVLFTSSIDEDVSFMCKVELAYLGINWRVNGSVITDPSFSTTRYVDNNVYIDTLTFRARRNYNTTVVQCFANGDGYVESKSASLRYQGTIYSQLFTY